MAQETSLGHVECEEVTAEIERTISEQGKEGGIMTEHEEAGCREETLEERLEKTSPITPIRYRDLDWGGLTDMLPVIREIPWCEREMDLWDAEQKMDHEINSASEEFEKTENMLIAYKRAGLKLFPLKENDKKPAVVGWQNWADQATEAGILKHLWEHPKSNWGIKMGDELLTVDVDCLNLRPDPFANREDFQNAPKAYTSGVDTKGIAPIPKKNGGGLHYTFRVPKGVKLGPSHGKLGAHIDTLSGNSYIAVAPSSFSLHGKYGEKEWAYQWDEKTWDGENFNFDPPMLPDDILERLTASGGTKQLPSGRLRFDSVASKEGSSYNVAASPKTTNSGQHYNYTAVEIKRAAAGKEKEILIHVAGIDQALLDGKGHPCPICGGGDDRFALRGPERGAEGCRKCEEKNAHDGMSVWGGDFIRAVETMRGVDYPKALKLIADYLGLEKNTNKQVVRQALPNDNIPDDSPLDFVDFPVDALPEGPMRDLAKEYTEQFDEPAAYIVPLQLSMVASIFGCSRWIEIKRNFKHPSIIFSAAIAKSGSGKTPAKLIAHAPIKAAKRKINAVYQKELPQKNNGAAGKNKITDHCPQITVGNFTIESLFDTLHDNPYGVLACYDEMGSWFGRLDQYKKNQSDVPVYSALWMGEEEDIGRKGGFGDGEKHRELNDPAMSISSFIQPNVLIRNIQNKPDFWDVGLVSRFLWTLPEGGNNFDFAEVSQDVADRWESLILRLYSTRTEIASVDNPAIYRPTEEGREILRSFLRENKTELRGACEKMQILLPKMIDHCSRIALERAR